MEPTAGRCRVRNHAKPLHFTITNPTDAPTIRRRFAFASKTYNFSKPLKFYITNQNCRLAFQLFPDITLLLHNKRQQEGSAYNNFRETTCQKRLQKINNRNINLSAKSTRAVLTKWFHHFPLNRITWWILNGRNAVRNRRFVLFGFGFILATRSE